jgi:hypothetical protein
MLMGSPGHLFGNYAAEQGLSEDAAIKKGLEEKAVEFAKAGDIYQKV